MTQAAKGAVFITGAATGIGAAATRRLAGAGYRVFAGVHRETASLASIPGVRLVAIDVTDSSGVEKAAKVVAEAVGGDGLKAVINNAGVIVQGPLELVPPEELRRQFEVNTLGPAHVIQAFLPLLRTGKGRIINISAPTARAGPVHGADRRQQGGAGVVLGLTQDGARRLGHPGYCHRARRD